MSSITDVYSPRTTFRCTRLRGAKVGSSVCQFCAVGCSQLGFFKDGKLIDVEGDPRSAVNEGRLLPPKGLFHVCLKRQPLPKGKTNVPCARLGSLGRGHFRLDAGHGGQAYLGHKK